MSSRLLTGLLLAASLGLAPALPALPAPARDTEGAAQAEQKLAYSGISLFRTYCSACHGVEARGDGPMADQLRYRPPDLTLIARRNGGKYPAEMVYRTIDGRKPVKGHGGPDMPVWGDAFKNTREGYDDESVRAKIQALVDYLEGVQAREPRK